jgi:hypothetical protein
MNLVQLMSLIERFTHICRKNNIVFWIVWGTLLGYIRHGNIIPWDYDIDLSMLEEEYNKLVRLFKQHQIIDGLYCDFNYYDNSEGCLFIYDEKDIGKQNQLGIDVISYKLINGILRNKMSKEVLESYPGTYDNLYQDIFPLKQVLFCGNYVNIPNNPTKILEYYGNYSEIPNEGKEWLTKYGEKFTTNPFIEIPSLENLKDNLNTTKPFIIRNCKDFDISLVDLMKTFVSDKKIWGYTNSDFDYEYIDPDKLIRDWINDNLTLTLLDTQASNTELLPNVLKSNTKYPICYMLTKKNNITDYHQDPDYGNGWMYMKMGKKLWWFISSEDMKYLSEHHITLDDIKNKTLAEMLSLLDNYLWGKIYVGEISDNDFLYFPENWIHKVYTYNKSFGLTGYFKL